MRSRPTELEAHLRGKNSSLSAPWPSKPKRNTKLVPPRGVWFTPPALWREAWHPHTGPNAKILADEATEGLNHRRCHGRDPSVRSPLDPRHCVARSHEDEASQPAAMLQAVSNSRCQLKRAEGHICRMDSDMSGPWRQNSAQEDGRLSPEDSGPGVSEAKIPAGNKALG